MPTAIFYPVLDNSRAWTGIGCDTLEHFDCVNEGVDYALTDNYLFTLSTSKLEFLYAGDGLHPTIPANYNGTDPVTKVRMAIYWKVGIPDVDVRFRLYDQAVSLRGAWDIQLSDTNWTKTRTSWVDVSGDSLTLADFQRGVIQMSTLLSSSQPYVAAIQMELEFTGFMSTSTSSSSTSSSSVTTTSSSSFYPGVAELGGLIVLKLQDLIDAVEAGKRLKPIAKIEIEDLETNEITVITEVTNFTVSVTSEPSSDSFGVTVADLETWSSRETAYPDLLIASQERLIKIYGGYRVEGVDYYIPFFQGIIAQDTLYVGGKSQSLTLRGYGKERLLVKTDGQHAAYTGSAKALVEEYLQAAGIDRWWFSFDDYQISNQEFNFTNAYQAIAYILGVPGNVEYFFDPEGVFIAQVHGGTQDPELYVRDSRNLLYLSRFTSADRIVTVADISGADEAASTVRYAGQAYLDRYGRTIAIFSSDLITTLQEAQDAGDEVIAESLLWENTIQFRVPFFPYLRPASIVKVYDEASSTLNSNVRLKRITVTFTVGSMSRIDATGVVVT